MSRGETKGGKKCDRTTVKEASVVLAQKRIASEERMEGGAFEDYCVLETREERLQATVVARKNVQEKHYRNKMDLDNNDGSTGTKKL